MKLQVPRQLCDDMFDLLLLIDETFEWHRRYIGFQQDASKHNDEYLLKVVESEKATLQNFLANCREGIQKLPLTIDMPFAPRRRDSIDDQILDLRELRRWIVSSLPSNVSVDTFVETAKRYLLLPTHSTNNETHTQKIELQRRLREICKAAEINVTNSSPVDNHEVIERLNEIFLILTMPHTGWNSTRLTDRLNDFVSFHRSIDANRCHAGSSRKAISSEPQNEQKIPPDRFFHLWAAEGTKVRLARLYTGNPNLTDSSSLDDAEERGFVWIQRLSRQLHRLFCESEFKYKIVRERYEHDCK